MNINSKKGSDESMYSFSERSIMNTKFVLLAKRAFLTF